MILQSSITVYFVLCSSSKGMAGKKRNVFKKKEKEKKALLPELNCSICVVD